MMAPRSVPELLHCLFGSVPLLVLSLQAKHIYSTIGRGSHVSRVRCFGATRRRTLSGGKMNTSVCDHTERHALSGSTHVVVAGVGLGLAAFRVTSWSLAFNKLNSSNKQNTTQCESPTKRRPVQFGLSIQQKRSFSAISNPGESPAQHKDCPICQKYSQGPCGELFTQWLKCTDDHPGMSNDKPDEEDHIEKCLHLATPLAQCLNKHQDYYESINVYDQQYEDDTDGIDPNELQEAWAEMIQELESNHTQPTPFPSSDICPKLEIRPSDGTGMAAFALESKECQPLVMAYIKDDTGKLLAAGSQDDLWDYAVDGELWGVLRLQISPQTPSRTVTAFALYSTNEEKSGDRLYSYSLQVKS